MASMSASCKTLITDAEKGPVQRYYALVHWHDDVRLFDISLTDCTHAWHASGCTTRRNEQNVSEHDAWMRTKEALSDMSPAGQYRYWTTAKKDQQQQQLQLWWGWDSGPYLGREAMMVQPPLQQQLDAPAAISRIMEHLMASYATLKAAVVQSGAAQQQLQRSLAEKEALLKEKIQAGQEQEKLMFTKFAMLINKKTDRIQQLMQRVQQQERELEQLRGAYDVDTDDEARQAEAAYAAETEDDESDELDGQQRGSMAHDQQQNWPVQPAADGGAEGDGLGKAAAAAAGEQDADMHMEGLETDTTSKAANAGAAAPAPAAAMDMDATQPLDDAALQALGLQRQQQQLRQQQQQQPVQMQQQPPSAAGLAGAPDLFSGMLGQAAATSNHGAVGGLGPVPGSTGALGLAAATAAGATGVEGSIFGGPGAQPRKGGAKRRTYL